METEAADATERLSQEISGRRMNLAGMKRAYSNAVLEYGKGSSEKELEEAYFPAFSGELRENRERDEGCRGMAEGFSDSPRTTQQGG